MRPCRLATAPQRSGEGPRAPGARRLDDFEALSLEQDWTIFDARHELTEAGEEKFSKDWNSLLARAAAAR